MAPASLQRHLNCATPLFHFSDGLFEFQSSLPDLGGCADLFDSAQPGVRILLPVEYLIQRLEQVHAPSFGTGPLIDIGGVDQVAVACQETETKASKFRSFRV